MDAVLWVCGGFIVGVACAEAFGKYIARAVIKELQDFADRL